MAPGQPVFPVVATITGDTSRPLWEVRGKGFEVPLVRLGPRRWQSRARFPRPGCWVVVVPNWAPVGVVLPAGAAQLALVVHRARAA